MKRIVFISLTVAVVFSGIFFRATEAGAVDLNHSFVAGLDLGFDLDPDLFASGLNIEYHVTKNVALGPLLTLGIDSEHHLFGTSGMAKYKANLTENEKLKPYGQVGVGFLIWEEEKKKGKKEDWEKDTLFLFPVGGGFEYWVNSNIAWGSNILFNITEDIFITFFAGIRYRF